MSKKEEEYSEEGSPAGDEGAREEVENTTEVQQESVETDKLQDELSEAKDKFLRLYAEFENFRRRTAKEKMDMILTANEQLLVQLIPIADDFERAEKAMKDKEDESLEGFSFIHNKFKKIFEVQGVKLMKVEKGDDFNADLHEAISQVPAPKENLKGKIIEVVEKGFLLKDKVIRFAKVIVGS